MLDEKNWFTEICDEAGSAFSLRIKRKLHEEHTPYQRIEIYETTDFGNLMVIDGFIMLSTRDNFFYHEMMAHPVMFTHPEPKRVCIIGGGDCGTLREVLRHKGVKKVWQIEIDEQVTRLSERYFPELCEANEDSRAKFLFADGIEWMAQAKPESLDVIIIDSTDPIGPAEGLFTEAFYQDCLNALSTGGLLVQQSESPLIHMEILLPMREAMRAAGAAEVKTLFFPQCVYPTGWWSATMARKGVPIEGFRQKDAVKRKFSTRYYNEAIHNAAQALPEFLKERIRG
ncbi:MAG TPA: polyamine aminopropyltransferase [Chromatiales bacterium]|nr:polyamine aminopropyltransferase [Chromatiales bacterium]